MKNIIDFHWHSFCKEHEEVEWYLAPPNKSSLNYTVFKQFLSLFFEEIDSSIDPGCTTGRSQLEIIR